MTLFRVIDAIYDIIGREEALASMLESLARHFGCASAALIYLDPGRPAANVEVSHGTFDEEASARYKAEFAQIDPAPAALARLRIGEAAATHRMFTPEERATSRFLKEFYHPLGLREALGAPIATEDGRFGVVAIHRGAERAPFDDDEIATFAELSKHVGRAIDLRRCFFAMSETVEDLQTALDQTAAGIMIFDAAGRLDHANAAARTIIARGDGLTLARSGQLGALDAAACKSLRAALSPVDGTRKPALVVVPRAEEDRGYVARVVPEVASGRLGWRVHIAEARSGMPIGETAVTVLRQALGLTLPGAKLVSALLAGEDLGDYAGRTGLTLNTVRFHLKSAFKTTGTNRQAELVALALGVLKDLGAMS